MSIIMATGFEHGTTDIAPTTLIANSTVVSSASHSGTYSLRTGQLGSSGSWAYPIGNITTVYTTFWQNMGNVLTGGTFYLYGVTAPTAYVLGFQCPSSGVWRAVRGGTVVATASVVVPDSNWHHYKAYMYLANSGGRLKLELDGVTILDFTGDTNAGSDTVINNVRFETFGNTYAYVDDLILDTATNWGDIRFNGLTPSSDVSVAWTPSTGATNYNLVDEVPYSDADYVETATDAIQDIYGLTDWTGTNKTPEMTVLWARALKTTVDTQQLKLIVKSGSTTDVGSAQEIFSTAGYIHRVDLTDPDTGTAWTDSGIDAMQVGMESEI